jgi:antitoxin VapB
VSDHPFQRVAFEPIGRDDLNACLSAWKHRMGELRRPTRGWDHGLRYGNELVAVVATDTLIRPRVAGFDRHQAIELSRLCAARPDICRVALRLWRLFVFPAIAQERGCSWALSYQDAAIHSGNLYRFDGWVRLGVSRSGVDLRTGRRGRSKVIWGWCDDPDVRRRGRPLPSEEESAFDGQRASGRVMMDMTLR